MRIFMNESFLQNRSNMTLLGTLRVLVLPDLGEMICYRAACMRMCALCVHTEKFHRIFLDVATA
jgi:hypothetical protein